MSFFTMPTHKRKLMCIATAILNAPGSHGPTEAERQQSEDNWGTLRKIHPRSQAITLIFVAAVLANQISMRLFITMLQNDIFKALADPTRRAIFEKLASGSVNASALRNGMAISQPAMSQHLSVLRNAKLVREQRQGRFVNYEINPEGLALIANWLAKYRDFWPTRIEALKTLLKDMDQ